MRSEHCIETIRSPAGPSPGRFLIDRLGRRLARGVECLLAAFDRAAQRRQLAELNDHMLRDIGLSRADVMAETTKPFWRS